MKPNSLDFNKVSSFVESPLYDNWFKRHNPHHSLLICSPYIKGSALDRILLDYAIAEKMEGGFDLKVLIRGNTEEFSEKKSSDISALDSLIALNKFDIENVKRVKNLHMKAYLVDGTHLLITSGNMTNSGMFVISNWENYEGGISTHDSSIISDFLNYFSMIWAQAEPLASFYDELLSAYTNYIKNDYSDKKVIQRIKRQQYQFSTVTSFDQANPTLEQYEKNRIESWEKFAQKQEQPSPFPHIPIDSLISKASTGNVHANSPEQIFSLSDIPPVGRLEQIPHILNIIKAQPNGISYLDLGKQLRPFFSKNTSDEDGTNRKYGEEKGKYSAFFGFATIEDAERNKVVKITKLGKSYLTLNEDDRKKLLKDIVFDKPIVVSILRHSIDSSNFNLLDYLTRNCEIGTETTLRRKASALADLFDNMRRICTDEELQQALKMT